MRALFISICLLPSVAYTQHYTHTDSVKAAAYFDSSWRYGMHTAKHQLYLDSALMVMPTNAYYWQQKSMPLYKAEKFELGRPYLDSAVKHDPDRWLDYAGYMKCIFEKDYRTALADFYQAKALYGNRVVMDHPYDFYIGLCHLQRNEYDSAAYYFQSCIEDTRKKLGEGWIHYNHLFYMGVANYANEEYTAANEYFDMTLKKYPNFSDAQFYKAYCMFKNGQRQEALVLMEQAWENHKAGYSLNEDNARYQYYPYQVRTYYIQRGVEHMREAVAKQ